MIKVNLWRVSRACAQAGVEFDDLTQEVWLGLHKAPIPEGTDGAHQQMRVRTLVLDALRRATSRYPDGARRALLTPQGLVAHDTSYLEAPTHDADPFLARHLRALDAQSQRAIRLLFFEGRTLAETGSAMGVCFQRVHRVKQRALKTLRKRMARETTRCA